MAKVRLVVDNTKPRGFLMYPNGQRVPGKRHMVAVIMDTTVPVQHLDRLNGHVYEGKLEIMRSDDNIVIISPYVEGTPPFIAESLYKHLLRVLGVKVIVQHSTCNQIASLLAKSRG